MAIKKLRNSMLQLDEFDCLHLLLLHLSFSLLSELRWVWRAWNAKGKGAFDLNHPAIGKWFAAWLLEEDEDEDEEDFLWFTVTQEFTKRNSPTKSRVIHPEVEFETQKVQENPTTKTLATKTMYHRPVCWSSVAQRPVIITPGYATQYSGALSTFNSSSNFKSLSGHLRIHPLIFSTVAKSMENRTKCVLIVTNLV